MNVVGKVGSLISQGVYSVATPFHPFGGAVDVIVVEQQDGSYRSTPWYVRFGKFQGVLKGAEKMVRIAVNGVEANFHMYLDNSGEAYFIREVVSEDDSNNGVKNSDNLDVTREDVDNSNDDTSVSVCRNESEEVSNEEEVNFSDDRVRVSTDQIEKSELDDESRLYEFEDQIPSCADSIGSTDYRAYYERLEQVEDVVESQGSDSEVVLFSVDGHVITAPLSSEVENTDNLQLDTPQFHLGPGERADFIGDNEESGQDTWTADFGDIDASATNNVPEDYGSAFGKVSESGTLGVEVVSEAQDTCNMGSGLASETFDAYRISEEEFKVSASSIVKEENLIVRFKGKYLPWGKATHLVLGMAAFGLELSVETEDTIIVETDETQKASVDTPAVTTTPSGRRWRLWPIAFRRVKTLQHTTSTSSNEDIFVDSESGSKNPRLDLTPLRNAGNESPHKKLVRTNIPTTEQIASLNLKDGQNMITFSFSTMVLGTQQVDAHIYLWKWNARIVISDVDGTITKSDVLGQFMPLVGKDWTQSGVTRLFSAIKENGYQLLFLSARAIVQAYLTRSFLLNIKQDGKTLPNGPVVISPDGLFPSLYREVIRRAPHEFKIACLEDIKALFPSDYNPFYAGFGNRDTDELSYRKIGIPKGKIFIINPKGEVAISHRIGVKSYTSLHTLVNDMFPPTSMVEQEDFNSWNYWRMPLPNIDL